MNRAIVQFDTYKFVKHLTENGFTEQQAEALANEQVNLLNSNLATKAGIEKVNANIEKLRLATKADIEKLRLATKVDIESLRQETKTDMANLHAELVKWVYAAMIAQVILIVSLVVVLVKLLP